MPFLGANWEYQMIQEFASCMHTSPYLSLANPNSLETSPNHHPAFSSTFTPLWSPCTVAAAPLHCPLVLGRRRKGVYATKLTNNRKMHAAACPSVPGRPRPLLGPSHPLHHPSQPTRALLSTPPAPNRPN
jgi:hypothetical protein